MMNTEQKKFIMTPIHIVSCIVGIIRQYLGTEDRIAIDQSKYVWKQNPRESDVFVSEEFNSDRDAVGKRPLVLVGFPQVMFPRDVMGDMMNYMPGGYEVRNISRAQGNIRLRCISESALASIELATELRYFIDVFRHQIQCSHSLDLLRSNGVQGPQRTEEYKEYWTTDVICDIVYQENWAVTIEHLKIKSINVDLTAK